MNKFRPSLEVIYEFLQAALEDTPLIYEYQGKPRAPLGDRYATLAIRSDVGLPPIYGPVDDEGYRWLSMERRVSMDVVIYASNAWELADRMQSVLHTEKMEYACRRYGLSVISRDTARYVPELIDKDKNQWTRRAIVDLTIAIASSIREYVSSIDTIYGDDSSNGLTIPFKFTKLQGK